MLELVVKMWGYFKFIYFVTLANQGHFFHKTPSYVSKSFFSGWKNLKKFPQEKTQNLSDWEPFQLLSPTF
jgi:hypothetical protein